MPIFVYESISLSGKNIRGEIEASGQKIAAEQLQQAGQFPISIREKGNLQASLIEKIFTPRTAKLSAKETASFLLEIAQMLDAAIALDRSISLLASWKEDKRYKPFLEEVLKKVRGGSTLSEALTNLTASCSISDASLISIKTAELSGGKPFIQTLRYIANEASKAEALKEELISALLYPALLSAVTCASVLLILLFVVPQFDPIFASSKKDLPFTTTIILAASHLLRHYGLIILGLLGGGALFLRYKLQSETMKMERDNWLLNQPIIGKFIRMFEAAKFCRTLSLLQTNGIALVDALPLAVKSMGNKKMAILAAPIDRLVREGKSLAKSLGQITIFPPHTMQMISLGEETGQLPSMLYNTAELYDADIKRRIQRFMALLTPAITILMGLIVATIIGSILTAILNLNDTIE